MLIRMFSYQITVHPTFSIAGHVDKLITLPMTRDSFCGALRKIYASLCNINSTCMYACHRVYYGDFSKIYPFSFLLHSILYLTSDGLQSLFRLLKTKDFVCSVETNEY